MEEFQKVENLAEHLKEYVNTRISLVKLEIAEKVSRSGHGSLACFYLK